MSRGCAMPGPFWYDSDDDATLVASSSETSSSRHRRRRHRGGGSSPRMADGITIRDDRLWPRDKRYLKVRFLDGSSEEKQLVESLIVKHYHAIPMHIRFKFLRSSDTSSSDIRITFTYSGSSCSYIGRDNENVAQDHYTMKLNTNWSSREKVQADILHEFGHALGLLHEQKHPGCRLKFNNPELKRKYGYNDDFIKRNYEKGSVIGTRTTPYDIYSIMHYPVDPGDTMSLLTHIPLNTVLSDGDRQLLMDIYPAESKPTSRVPDPVLVSRPKTTTTTTTTVNKPRRETKLPKIDKSQPVYLSGSGNKVVDGGYIMIQGSGNVIINGDSEVMISGSGNVVLNGNGKVCKSGSGTLTVNGNCSIQSSGSGTIYVRGSGTAKLSGSGSINFTGKGTGSVSGSGSIRQHCSF